MEYLDNIGKRAQAAKPDLQHLKSEEKKSDSKKICRRSEAPCN